jgi:ribosomal protein S18 acetylase RimI-like enzyme
MLVKDLWLSKASNINCFNVKTLSKAKIIKKNTLISCKIKYDKKDDLIKKKNNSKFKLIGQNVIFSKNINIKNISPNINLDFEVSKKKDEQKIINICLKNMKSSRFDLDLRIPRIKVKKIRVNWISSYFLKLENKFIYSVLFKNKLVGLLCVLKKKKNIIIDLIAISKKYNGKGFGSAIIDNLQLQFPKLKNIIVGTYKKNKKAMLFYKKYGFKEIKTYNVFHYYEK